ncbi:hypothetical protein C8F04DRAFT_1190505 [Mycena alexandri]|uniref:Uncharacterized protein n=1 Tax=Mycena alexandri TaxID=1745969 RepID=A0AAD6SJ56_9AGAR|nr:hypothetical protein C8F04DRAFT_1190505 [Mycena alexandri]
MSILPSRPIHGHYCHNREHVFTVHHGSSQTVLKTPLPDQARPLDSDYDRVPRFRELRYISLEFVYLMWVPKHNPFHLQGLRTLNYPRHRLPIVKEEEGWCLAKDVREDWLTLECTLRNLGRAMLKLGPQRWLHTIISPWFFPGRFKFMRKFQTEEAARLAAWYSIDNFLPLIAYATFGFWCMAVWVVEELEKNNNPPDWRSKVIEATNIKPALLDIFEDSLADWPAIDRVGGLYHVQSRRGLTPDEREKRAEMERLLERVLHCPWPIPLYVYWGAHPGQFLASELQKPFEKVVPSQTDLLDFDARRSPSFNFVEYILPHPGFEWVRVTTVTDASPGAIQAPSVQPVVTAPFPVRPPTSQQKHGESIQAFFHRRRESNSKKAATESSEQRHRRKQLDDRAKKGGVPKKAHVFYWEKRDGHYIRLPATRAEFEDMWADYPASQRRFDSFRNEWDLADIFADGDPVFGDDFEQPPSFDSDDEDMDDHPHIPRDVLQAAAAHMPSTSDGMDLVDQQHPVVEDRDFEFDVTSIMALGPDYQENDVPKPDGAKDSEKYLQIIHRNRDLAPRKDDPIYESIGETLLDTLFRRFGFLPPPTLGTFRLREPTEHFDVDKDLANLLGRERGQTTKDATTARGWGSIEMLKINNQIPVDSPFSIKAEKLRSMSNRAEEQHYFVLRRKGVDRLGQETPSRSCAKDGGPDLRDIIGHLIARGIPFWHAVTSAEIMPAVPAEPAGERRKGYRPDLSSGHGFRPAGHVFDEIDYTAYKASRDTRLLHTPRGRIGLQYGGIIARLTREEVSDEDFHRQIGDDLYDVGDCLWDGTSGHSYWYDRLWDREIDLLCGVYHLGTGQKRADDTDQTAAVSWWPRPSAWARGSLAASWWTPQCEDDFYKRRLSHFENRVYSLTNATKWRSNLKYRVSIKKCCDGYEVWASDLFKSNKI